MAFNKAVDFMLWVRYNRKEFLDRVVLEARQIHGRSTSYHDVYAYIKQHHPEVYTQWLLTK